MESIEEGDESSAPDSLHKKNEIGGIIYDADDNRHSCLAQKSSELDDSRQFDAKEVAICPIKQQRNRSYSVIQRSDEEPELRKVQNFGHRLRSNLVQKMQ